jgi:hypothetical protein
MTGDSSAADCFLRRELIKDASTGLPGAHQTAGLLLFGFLVKLAEKLFYRQFMDE